MKKIERMKELINTLNNASNAYYNQSPIMSDYEWDKLYDELATLEYATEIVLADSPTHNVGYSVADELKEVAHNHPMLSLDKTKSVDELIEFIGNMDCFLSVKADGLTTSLHYINGKLIGAETRGDGVRGTECLQNVLTMKNVPKDLKEKLSEYCYISVAYIEKKQISRYDGTVKYLFKFNDEQCVESVVMSYHHGHTICISTQVGCKMGCKFCATGKQGFTRNLTAGEMIAQIESAQKDLNIRISNIVLMGMGEPLDNYDNVMKFLDLVSSDDGLNIGKRHITLSTCGIVPRIYDLADRKLQITLSVSLHAPTDKMRSATMPINDAYNIDELMKAIKYYIDKTNRRVSFEYAMIDGVNDSDEAANILGNLIKGMLCHVNLIPVNDVTGNDYRKSNKERLISFTNVLAKYGITATVRRTLGSDIDASCGQLKGKHKKGGK